MSFKVSFVNRQAPDERWDSVSFANGWITCSNVDEPGVVVYYPTHIVRRVKQLNEESLMPERRDIEHRSWDDLPRM